LVSKLAEILAEKSVNQNELSRILSLLFTTTHGSGESIGDFFHLIGSSFSLIVNPIIAGLELFSSSSDWRTRVVCNSAIAQLVLENQSKISSNVQHCMEFLLSANLDSFFFNTIS
jgi:hypothetical protein